MVIAGIFAALFLVVAVVVIIYFTKSRNNDRLYIRQQQQDLSKLRQDIQSLEAQAKTSERNYQETLLNNCDLLKTISDLRIELANYENSDEVELTRIKALIDGANQNLATINESISAASLRLTSLENDFKERQQALATELQSSNDARATLLEEQNQLKEAILASKQELEDLVKEKDLLTSVLLELNERHRVALLSNGQNTSELGLKFELNQKETQLVAAIKDICELYPDLSRELKKIEWEKVWRPKIQVYRTEYAGKQGIYKLTLTSDTEVCYIGQARDIYTRGFEHMKKMIGVEAKGNEKLYEYGVADFYWKLLEEINDADKLNDAEHYWIEYGGCLEKGLNKKR